MGYSPVCKRPGPARTRSLVLSALLDPRLWADARFPAFANLVTAVVAAPMGVLARWKGFWHELRRRRVTRVGGVYIVGGAGAITFVSEVGPSLEIPDWAVPFMIVVALAGLPVALVMAWTYELAPDGGTAAPTLGSDKGPPVLPANSLSQPPQGAGAAANDDETRGRTSPTAPALDEQLAARLAEIDDRINALLPGRLVAPTRNFAPEPFSSEKLLLSLAALGMPPRLTLRIADVLDRYLVDVVEGVDTITTAHIRKAVSLAIYGLAGSISSEPNADLWGDRYARRYGNPDERIQVIQRDGTSEFLDYTFVKSRLIPHVVEHVFDTRYERVRDTVIRKQDFRAMSREILEHVKGLNLYSIRYKTLFNLVRDLATQPPNPWFVEDAFIPEIVEHELQRAGEHRAPLEDRWSAQNLSMYRHSLGELIHHSSSALLAFYGAFIGAGHLRPLHQLVHNLQMVEEDQNPVLWDFYRMSQLEGDLEAVGESRGGLYRLAQRIQNNVNDVPDRKLRAVGDDGERLFNVVESVIRGRVRGVNEVVERVTSGDELTLTELEQLMIEVLSRIPGVVDVRKINRSGNVAWLWMRHDIDSSLFREIKPRVLVAGLSGGAEVTADGMESVLREAKGLLGSGGPLANTMLCVAGGHYADSARESLQTTLEGGELATLATVGDLVDIADSRNRLRALEALIAES